MHALCLFEVWSTAWYSCQKLQYKDFSVFECQSEDNVDWSAGWLFCFMTYQPFSGHLTVN